MRVLLIEDDPATAQSIELMLKSQGMNTYTTDLAQEGIELAKLYDYDMILLDLTLPDLSGFDVVSTLRRMSVHTPLMILSDFNSINDKIRGLVLGADDCLAKPFHKDELVARIHAIVRRTKGMASTLVTVGELTINPLSKTVLIRGNRLHLTGKEYSMLELFFMRRGATLTKEAFLNHLYGGMNEPELKIIDVFICKLRKKIAAQTDGANYIETIWGRGYMLKEPEKEDEAIPA